MSILLNRKVTKNDCNCGMYHKHYFRRNITAETKNRPPPKKKIVMLFTFLKQSIFWLIYHGLPESIPGLNIIGSVRYTDLYMYT